MKPTVLKFGGTSVQDADAIRQLSKIVSTRLGPRVVIVSALAKVTDALLRIAKHAESGDIDIARAELEQLQIRHLDIAKSLKLGADLEKKIVMQFQNALKMLEAFTILKDVSLRSKDMLLSCGELSSSLLVFGQLLNDGFEVSWFDSRTLIKTTSDFGEAAVLFAETNKEVKLHLQPLLVGNKIVIGQGFIASDISKATTTLGRGGSDYSAAILGAALESSKVEIWTDVNGILSTDPRVVKEAATLPVIHFLEAAELAFFGAKVIHPATIYPAVKNKIPVYVLNSKNPTHVGTEITFEQKTTTNDIRGIAFKRNVTLVNIYSTRMLGSPGFLKTVFDVFAKNKLSVDLISTSEVNISLTLDPNFNERSLRDSVAVLSEFAEIEIKEGKSIISVVGAGIRRTPGVVAKIFSQIAEVNVQMISMGASELNISFVVDSAQTDHVVQTLHKGLIKFN